MMAFHSTTFNNDNTGKYWEHWQPVEISVNAHIVIVIIVVIVLGVDGPLGRRQERSDYTDFLGTVTILCSKTSRGCCDSQYLAFVCFGSSTDILRKVSS